MTLSTQPAADAALDALAALPETVRSEVQDRLAACRRMAEAPRGGLMAVAKTIAAENAGREGWSVPQLRRLYYRWQGANGDWKAVLDKAKAGATYWAKRTPAAEASPSANPAFRAEVRRRFEGHQRNNLRAWAKLIADRRAWTQGGAPISGLTRPPEAEAATGYPAGWSYDNLMRLCSPDRYDAALARIGSRAAAQFRPSVPITRVGLVPGQYVEFDDHEFDFKILFPGQPKPMRPRGFFAIDAASGYLALNCLKPTFWDAENEIKRTLTETDFAWFVAAYLTEIGYLDKTRTGGPFTTLVVEHGTAAIRDELRSALEMVTHGAVAVEESGIIGRRSGASGFAGQGRGNFKFKGHVESWFNLLNNWCAALPNQVGKDRDHAPEVSTAMDRFDRDVLALSTVLPPDVAKLLRFGSLTWDQFGAVAMSIIEAINTRHDHELEGWEAAGYVAREWRVSPDMPWLPASRLEGLPDAERMVMRRIIDCAAPSAPLERARKLSPAEVFRAGAGRARRLPYTALPVLMGSRGLAVARELTVRQGTITLEGREYGLQPLMFLAIDGGGHPLRDGSKWNVLVSPVAPSVAVLMDAQGRVACVCPRWDRVRRDDEEGLNRAMGAQVSWETSRLNAMRGRHAVHIEQHRELLAQLAAVAPRPAGKGAATPPKSAEERRQDAIERQLVRNFEDAARTEAGAEAARDLVAPPAPEPGEANMAGDSCEAQSAPQAPDFITAEDLRAILARPDDSEL